MKTIELFNELFIEDQLYYELSHNRLPDYFLYLGEHGSGNWIKLDGSSSFDVASGLTQLLKEHVVEIVSVVPPNINLAGIGIGTGEKERILLEEMTKLSKHLVYYPMDISSELVQKAIQRVEHLPIEVMGIIGRFQDIENVASHWRHDIMISVLGNNFSNYHPDQFFGKLKSVVESDDLLLIDANLFPSTGNENAHRRRIEETYSSDLNKKFNISPLTKRGVPEAACEFDIQLKPTQSNWGTVYRTHKTIRILQDVSVDCGGREILLSQGDTIELGFTYKYTKEQILSLAPRFGFKVEQHYLNEDNTNILMLLSKETL